MRALDQHGAGHRILTLSGRCLPVCSTECKLQQLQLQEGYLDSVCDGSCCNATCLLRNEMPHASIGWTMDRNRSEGEKFFRTPSRCSTQALITGSSQNSRSLVALHRCDEKGKKGKSLASQCADHIVNGQPEGSLQVCSLRNIDSQTPRAGICQASPLQVLSCCDCRIQATTVGVSAGPRSGWSREPGPQPEARH